MKIKTSEATGLQLDWGVAKAMEYSNASLWRGRIWAEKNYRKNSVVSHIFDFQDLLEGNCQQLSNLQENRWMAQCYNYKTLQVDFAIGSTPAQAVARCVIAMRLGDEFEYPSELGVMG